jgi:hypothetical protein
MDLYLQSLKGNFINMPNARDAHVRLDTSSSNSSSNNNNNNNNYYYYYYYYNVEAQKNLILQTALYAPLRVRRDSCGTVCPRNVVCFRCISVDTLRTGNNNNNNNNSKSFRKHLGSVPGKRDIKELQKTAIVGTAHILREVLM